MSAQSTCARGEAPRLVVTCLTATERREANARVLLPDLGRFAAVEKELSGASVGAVFAVLSAASALVTIPRFSIHAPTFSVAAQLRALGMTDAFDPERADFTHMMSPQPLHLALSDVVQQAYVDVSESGTKAAAATAVVVYGDDDGAGPPALEANRPFFFLIRDISSDTVLFVGRVLDPT